MEFDPSAITESVTELVSTWGLQVVGALAVLIIGRVVCGVLRRAARSSGATSIRRSSPSSRASSTTSPSRWC
ncbi:MAG: hypothetical protein ACR2P8_09720 [Myxococcota bacterium]